MWAFEAFRTSFLQEFNLIFFIYIWFYKKAHRLVLANSHRHLIILFFIFSRLRRLVYRSAICRFVREFAIYSSRRIFYLVTSGDPKWSDFISRDPKRSIFISGMAIWSIFTSGALKWSDFISGVAIWSIFISGDPKWSDFISGLAIQSIFTSGDPKQSDFISGDPK